MIKRDAFGLIEVVISLSIMTILLTVSMRTLSVAKRREGSTVAAAVGRQLADDMLQEILGQSYQDPDGSPNFGTEDLESTAARQTLDDVDDYHGLVDSPPTDRDGLSLSRYAGMQRNVAVQWVQATSPHSVTASESGIKRITVIVTDRDGKTLQLSGYRAAIDGGAAP